MYSLFSILEWQTVPFICKASFDFFIDNKTYYWFTWYIMKHKKYFKGWGNIFGMSLFVLWETLYLLHFIHQQKKFHFQVHQLIFHFYPKYFYIIVIK